MIDKDYLDKIKQRGKESHVYRKYQLIGLTIADLLEDQEHKSLYIKLAKEIGGEKMLEIAKTVAEKKEIERKGAYFMKILKEKNLFKTNGQREK